MARRGSIALYTSPKGVHWRRLSEPSTYKTVRDDEVFAAGHAGSPKAFRRYSFSALEDYRKGKLPDKVHEFSGTFSSPVNLSPLAIRGQVDQILEKNGFTETEKAKVTQLRRYSENIDKDVVNLLGDGVRRSSFGAGIATRAFSRNVPNTSKTIKSIKYKCEGNSSTLRCAVPPQHGWAVHTSTSDAPKLAWVDSEYPPRSNPSSIKQNQGFNHDSEWDKIKTSKMEDLDEHLQLKRSLWKGRCRRDSLAKFRNRVVDALRSYIETDTEYWRRCRSINYDNEPSKVPMCKYRLRENGLIASELANSTKIDIETSINKSESYGLCDSWRNASKDEHTPETDTPNKAEVLHNLLKRRRKSSLFSEYDSDRKTLVQRSLSSFSDRNSRGDSPDISLSQASLYQRSLSRQDLKAEDFSDSEAYLAYLRANLRRPSCEKRRWSQTPSDGFELIGSAALHGTPGYKGRLMLLTARTVRFHDDFNSQTCGTPDNTLLDSSNGQKKT
ncbi:hypothetical protein RRG08_004349 [Elysia crispata]|uniref:Uncharacterized protein n=1 Tax=Elysia crispata TaxID=231223 RepID=A0AAE1AYS6_9GAST|nr:hypothetical protein RRG08_004349 [Elysia crispata]